MGSAQCRTAPEDQAERCCVDRDYCGERLYGVEVFFHKRRKHGIEFLDAVIVFDDGPWNHSAG
jgi:hypothetical protein